MWCSVFFFFCSFRSGCWLRKMHFSPAIESNSTAAYRRVNYNSWTILLREQRVKCAQPKTNRTPFVRGPPSFVSRLNVRTPASSSVIAHDAFTRSSWEFGSRIFNLCARATTANYLTTSNAQQRTKPRSSEWDMMRETEKKKNENDKKYIKAGKCCDIKSIEVSDWRRRRRRQHRRRRNNISLCLPILLSFFSVSTVFFSFGCRHQLVRIPVRIRLAHDLDLFRQTARDPFSTSSAMLVRSLPDFLLVAFYESYATTFNLASMDCVRYENDTEWFFAPAETEKSSSALRKRMERGICFTLCPKWRGFHSDFVCSSVPTVCTINPHVPRFIPSVQPKNILNKTFYCIFRVLSNSWKMETQVKRWNAFSAQEIPSSSFFLSRARFFRPLLSSSVLFSIVPFSICPTRWLFYKSFFFLFVNWKKGFPECAIASMSQLQKKKKPKFGSIETARINLTLVDKAYSNVRLFFLALAHARTGLTAGRIVILSPEHKCTLFVVSFTIFAVHLPFRFVDSRRDLAVGSHIVKRAHFMYSSVAYDCLVVAESYILFFSVSFRCK